jgi:hypothetical protein
MVPVVSLWLPVILSAVLVFVVSSVIHMATPFHRGDYRPLPREAEVMAALRPLAIPPGDYIVPHASSMAAMRDQSFKDKMNAGPVGTMTIVPNGPPAVGGSLGMWFLYGLAVSIFTAYVTAHAVPPGVGWRGVFRIAGCVSFASYSLALVHGPIWYKRSWATACRGMIDGAIYGAVTAATFGWLWH